ncbi:MAG: hypothetical protein AAGM84_05665 [Pseudomonadota bacterium]
MLVRHGGVNGVWADGPDTDKGKIRDVLGAIQTDTLSRTNSQLPLPLLAAATKDLSVDGEFRVLILGDSKTSKYTISPTDENFGNFLSYQFAERENTVLETAVAVTGGPAGTLGADVPPADDATVGIVGEYHSLGDGSTIRVRTGGVDPVADMVKVFFVQEPGAGSLTVTLTHQDGAGSGQTSVTIDCNGSRESSFVEVTLPGQVTGSATGRRLLIDLTATGGDVKVLRPTFAYDTLQTGMKLTPNRWGGRGGYTFPGATEFEANKSVIGKHILDMNPHLIIVEFADPITSGHEYINSLLAYLAENNFLNDIVLVGSDQVYEAGVTDDLAAGAILIDGELVPPYLVHAEFLQEKSNQYPNVQTFLLSKVVPSQAYSLAAGFTVDDDHVHPQPAGNMALASAIAHAIPLSSLMRGWQYLRQMIVRDIRLPGSVGADPDDPEVSARIESEAAGDVRVSWKRNWIFANWFNGVEEVVTTISRFGVATKELRFFGSNSRITSLANGQIDINGARLLNVGSPAASGDAVPLSFIVREATAADIASATAAVNTAGKVQGGFAWDTTNLRMMRANGPGTNASWVAFDGSVTVTPT